MKSTGSTNKRRFKVLMLILSSVILFASCQKVITINLNEHNPQLVIEGTITNQPGPYTVTLTNTANFDEANVFPPVSGAIVTIRDNVGNAETLVETGLGIYTTSSMQGIVGRIYTLSVKTNGAEYTASSTLHAPVAITKLMIGSQSLPKGTKKTLQVRFQDEAGIANYYRFIKTINSKVQPEIFIEDDLKEDGKLINLTLLSKKTTEETMNSGDTIQVTLQAIDDKVYTYFRTLLVLSGSGGLMNQSASPANPVSNFNQGALGYFNACALSSEEIIVP